MTIKKIPAVNLFEKRKLLALHAYSRQKSAELVLSCSQATKSHLAAKTQSKYATQRVASAPVAGKEIILVLVLLVACLVPSQPVSQDRKLSLLKDNHATRCDNSPIVRC